MQFPQIACRFEIRLQDLAATINDIVKCGGNKTHCNGEKRIVRLARIISCRCPLDGLKPVDSNYEIVHRGDCDCDFKPNATRHPTRRPFASRHCVGSRKVVLRTMCYAGFGRDISLHCLRMQVYCYIDAYIILSARRDVFFFFTTDDRSEKIPISQ